MIFKSERHEPDYKKLFIESVEIVMALSADFQAQLTRLVAYVSGLEAAGSATAAAAAKDAEDTQALTSALDAAGAPPVPATPPTDVPPTA